MTTPLQQLKAQPNYKRSVRDHADMNALLGRWLMFGLENKPDVRDAIQREWYRGRDGHCFR